MQFPRAGKDIFRPEQRSFLGEYGASIPLSSIKTSELPKDNAFQSSSQRDKNPHPVHGVEAREKDSDTPTMMSNQSTF
ncbi:hypothetical protein NXS19_013304 [Fusarium pseudograminearum]|nr:hypothetical protein NXS19_013304 [Fusarium pseudograminearum]